MLYCHVCCQCKSQNRVLQQSGPWFNCSLTFHILVQSSDRMQRSVLVKPPGTFSVKEKSIIAPDRGFVSLYAVLIEICHEMEGNNGTYRVLVLIMSSGSGERQNLADSCYYLKIVLSPCNLREGVLQGVWLRQLEAQTWHILVFFSLLLVYGKLFAAFLS